ncbi:hypothetical protein CXG81DRAFT_14783 [Caulochytrium protostelioides]|uniref:Clathrin adaptor, mu subunit n=1 Tax=Caulochytrium protostelioides TaxID=1555241 RepID=A0A4P9X084_9FUNG|nr:clathrin adaptor, mu subunit [Caulochytrium protostelioides]RKO99244.1 hypothetical protein CXG81DRAFT_14783 [Caulochytrium protostelioides]|eukprot:RKO99244.1 hypothetical protein CXG81DRAFT_14783 [Caulochytrium protostelioides]
MLSGFFIFNFKGEALISRLYRHDIKRSVTDVFRIQVISSNDVRSPVATFGSTSFCHIRADNVYLVGVTKMNANSALIFEFLYKVAALGRSYFGKFDEETVKNNFTLIYEIMDEICDFGYPQNTESDSLKMYITTQGIKAERAVMEHSDKIAIQATGAVSWRRPGIHYKKNEAFLDVIENVNVMVSKDAVLRSNGVGRVLMRSYLSGMPECKFGLNDRVLLKNGEENGSFATKQRPRMQNQAKKNDVVLLDDCQFHQCVRLSSSGSQHAITFVPPDGEFELMRYRTGEDLNIPFRINSIINEIDRDHVEYRISLRSHFPAPITGQDVVMTIPTPLSTASTKITVSAGKAKYTGSENAIVWKISTMQSGQDFLLVAKAELTPSAVPRPWSRPPISLRFHVLMFTASGLVVRYLKIFERTNYPVVKWVRYMTQFDYKHRIGGPSG